MFHLVSQTTDVEAIKEKLLEMWMEGTVICSSLCIFEEVFYILLEQKIQLINSAFLSEASQIITNCLNTHMKDYTFFLIIYKLPYFNSTLRHFIFFKDEYFLRENISPFSSMPKLVFVMMETGSSRELKVCLKRVAENCQNYGIFMTRINVLGKKIIMD